MRPEYATLLDNWFPGESWLVGRRGYRTWATGLGAPVESLIPHRCQSSNLRLFAASGSNIHEVTTRGAVGAAVQSGLTSSRWQSTVHGTSAGTFTCMVNGYDDYRYFGNGSWTTPTMTGVDTKKLVGIDSFKKRLIFTERNSASFWYLDVDAVSGTLTEFDLASQFRRGGYLMATGTWTRDGGDGVDDLFVAVSSQGEVVIYQGTDPGVAANWSLVGVFRIAPPLGRRCMIRLGADLIIMTEDGFSKLSQFIAVDRASSRAAMSDPITGAIKEVVNSYKDRFGWQPCFYPSTRDHGAMIIFNIPSGANHTQFVSNATTGAWCRFSGMDALCWEEWDGKLFFGDENGNVMQANYGYDDNGSAIEFNARQAYSYFGNRQSQKKFNLVRPNLILSGPTTVYINADTDYQDSYPDTEANFSDPSGVSWDAVDWDSSEWSDAPRPSLDWVDATGYGYAAALRMRITMDSSTPRWNSTTWLFEPARSAGYL